MSQHWRLALQNTVWMLALAVPVGLAILYGYGGTYAGAFIYGVGVGILSFVSMALTVSLLTKPPYVWRVVGVGSFFVRYGFAMAALGVPAYLGLWPVVAMLGGFAGVYLAENVVLLPRMMRALGEQTVKSAGHPADERLERRAEV